MCCEWCISPLLTLLTLLTLVHSTRERKSRCLLVSVDNRGLNADVHSNHYPTVSALLNKEYASYHGYDYLQLVNVIDDLEKQVQTKYTSFDAIPPTDNAKDAATAFHVGLHQFRAASWAKLPPLWDVTVKYGQNYEYIFYIDSDAVISPFYRNQSIDDLLSKWQERNKVQPPIKGQRDIDKATFIFFNNFPWRDDMPCAGTFIFRPNAAAEAILREWWDFNGIPDRNFKHFHEQDALWHMIDGHPTQPHKFPYRINATNYTILGERQFPSAWQRFETLWLVHIASYNYLIRNPILNIFLKSLDLHDPVVYSTKISEIKIYKVPTLEVCEKMEERSKMDGSRIPLQSFPVYPITNESEWWNRHVSSANVERMSLGELYDGRLVVRKGEFWMVLNNTRRGFPSFDTFTKMGFESDMAFPLTLGEVRSIPEGEPLPALSLSSAGSSGHLLSKMLRNHRAGGGRHRRHSTPQ